MGYECHMNYLTNLANGMPAASSLGKFISLLSNSIHHKMWPNIMLAWLFMPFMSNQDPSQAIFREGKPHCAVFYRFGLVFFPHLTLAHKDSVSILATLLYGYATMPCRPAHFPPYNILLVFGSQQGNHFELTTPHRQGCRTKMFA